MNKRKTIEVAELISMTNLVLARSQCAPDIRQGMMNLLEAVLHKTGNYAGYRYLKEGYVPDGARPGINSIDLDIVGRFENTDITRVEYF